MKRKSTSKKPTRRVRRQNRRVVYEALAAGIGGLPWPPLVPSTDHKFRFTYRGLTYDGADLMALLHQGLDDAMKPKRKDAKS